jgi:hypothetical protein
MMITSVEYEELAKAISADGAKGHADAIVFSLAKRAKNREPIGEKTLEWLSAYPRCAELIEAIIDGRKIYPSAEAALPSKTTDLEIAPTEARIEPNARGVQTCLF